MKTTKKPARSVKSWKLSPKAKATARVDAALRVVADLRAHLDASATELARVKRERDTWARATDEATQATAAARRERDEALREKVDSEAKLFALASEAGGASDAAIASVQRSAVKAGIEAAAAPTARAPQALPHANAYLMAHLDLATMKIVDAMIMSDPYPTQVRSGMRWLRIMDVEASSYDEAHNRLFESVIAETSHANWARRWVLEHDATMPHPGDVFLSAGTPVAAVAPGVVTAVGHKATVVVPPEGVSVDFPALVGPPPSLSAPPAAKPPPALSPREQEVRRYVEHGVCPRCGSEVDLEPGASAEQRDSSNDVHRCEKCGWSCGEVEVWAARGALGLAPGGKR